jgi:hypothetical protein
MLLVLHIGAGLLSIGAGAVALCAAKGGQLHRRSGRVFAYAMFLMATTGSLVAVVRGQRLNTVMGVLTAYLVATALLALRRRGLALRWLEAAGMLVAFTVGLYDIALGFEIHSTPTGTIDGIPAAPAFVFGAVALLAAIGDARMIAAGGLTGARRIARHLWRMCFAMFIATGSFFLGQADEFPRSIRIIPLLAVPVLAVLLLLVYWMGRVLLTKRFRHA